MSTRTVKPYFGNSTGLRNKTRALADGRAIAPLMKQKLLGIDTSAKTAKGAKANVSTGIIYMCPAESVADEYRQFKAKYPMVVDELWHKSWGLPVPTSRMNVCPFAGACKHPCLAESGRAEPKGDASDNVRQGRIWKTLLFYKGGGSYNGGPGPDFENLLTKEILAHAKSSTKQTQGKQRAIRLNGTSDFPYEDYPFIKRLMKQLAGRVQFYDYTKNHNRVQKWIRAGKPVRGGMHLTYSMGAKSDTRYIPTFLQQGVNVAMVWLTKELKDKAMREGVRCMTVEYRDGRKETIDLGGTFPVIDGDIHDARFLDEKTKKMKKAPGWNPSFAIEQGWTPDKGAIVGLYAKGKTGDLDTHPELYFFQHRVNSRPIAGDNVRHSSPMVCEVNTGSRANPVIDVPFRRIHAGMTTTLASRVSRAVGMSWQDWAEYKPSVVISKILRSKSLSREASQRLANEIRAWVARNSRKAR